MMMLRLACPKCKQQYKVPEEMLGKKVRCSGCGNRFVASPTEPPSPAAPEAGTGSTVRFACIGCMETFELPEGTGGKMRCSVCKGLLVQVPRKPPKEQQSGVPSKTALRAAGAGAVVLAGIGLLWLAFAAGTKEQERPPQAASARPVPRSQSSEHLIAAAEEEIAKGNPAQAKKWLQTYLTTRNAAQIDRANRLLQEIERAVSDKGALLLLKTFSDAELVCLAPQALPPLPPGAVLNEVNTISNPRLRDIYEQTLRRNYVTEKVYRDDILARQIAVAAAAREKLEEERRDRVMKDRREQTAKKLRALADQIKADLALLRKQDRQARSKKAEAALRRYWQDANLREVSTTPREILMGHGILMRIHGGYLTGTLTKDNIAELIKSRTFRDPSYWREAAYLSRLMGDWLPEYKEGPEHDVTLGEAWQAFISIVHAMLKNGEGGFDFQVPR
jgi:predicted Zn finger-like uncharacterized protein